MFRQCTCLTSNLSAKPAPVWSLVVVTLFLCGCIPTANMKEVDCLRSTWITRTEQVPQTSSWVCCVSLRGGIGYGQPTHERNVTKNPGVLKTRNTVRRKRAQTQTVSDLHEGQETKTSTAVNQPARMKRGYCEVTGTVRRKKSQIGVSDAVRNAQEEQTQSLRVCGMTKPAGKLGSTVRRKSSQRGVVSHLLGEQEKSTIQNAETGSRVARTEMGRGQREIVNTVQRKRAHIGAESVLRKGQERWTEIADEQGKDEIDSVDSSLEQRNEISDTVARKKAQIESTEHAIGQQEMVTRRVVGRDTDAREIGANRNLRPEDAVHTITRKTEQIRRLTALREEEERRTRAAAAVDADALMSTSAPVLEPEPGGPQMTPILRGAKASSDKEAARKGRAGRTEPQLRMIAAVIDDITGTPRTRMKRAKQMRRLVRLEEGQVAQTAFQVTQNLLNSTDMVLNRAEEGEPEASA